MCLQKSLQQTVSIVLLHLSCAQNCIEPADASCLIFYSSLHMHNIPTYKRQDIYADRNQLFTTVACMLQLIVCILCQLTAWMLAWQACLYRPGASNMTKAAGNVKPCRQHYMSHQPDASDDTYVVQFAAVTSSQTDINLNHFKLSGTAKLSARNLIAPELAQSTCM